MKKYICRSGVILTKICDSFFLIATKEARYYCPYIRQINRTAALMTDKLQHGATQIDLQELLISRFGIDQKKAATDSSMFLRLMAENGYINNNEDTPNEE